MDFDALKTPQDDTVRDGAAFDTYLRSSELIDSDHPEIVAYVTVTTSPFARR